VSGGFGQRIAPHAEAVRHVCETLLAEGQRAGAVGVIGFAEEEDGGISFGHGVDYIIPPAGNYVFS
ncbi:MAG: hypothetical protein JW963_09305, partial [Anaerolineales bacterium]|nr:hypothetical protein [Anaerolineales bacterium]